MLLLLSLFDNSFDKCPLLIPWLLLLTLFSASVANCLMLLLLPLFLHHIMSLHLPHCCLDSPLLGL